MAFTTTLPVWLAPGSQPAQAFITAGFKENDGAPADWFNYQWYWTYQALLELQTKAGEVKTINGAAPDTNGNIVVETGGGTAATVSVQDVGNYYTSDNVEGVLQEIGQFSVLARGSMVQSAQALLQM